MRGKNTFLHKCVYTLVLISVFLFYSTFTWARDSACLNSLLKWPYRIVQETVAGHRVDVVEFLDVPKKRGYYSKIAPELLFKNADKEVLIGISPRQGHFYLMIGGVRFDGLVLEKALVREGISGISHGYFMRITGLTDEQVEALKAKARRIGQERTLNCVSSVCDVLQQGADVEIADGKGRGYLMTTTLRRLLRHGLHTKQGQRLGIQHFRTTTADFSKTLRRLHLLEVWYGAGGLAAEKIWEALTGILLID